MLVIFYTVVLIENLQIGAGQQILKMTYFGGFDSKFWPIQKLTYLFMMSMPVKDGITKQKVPQTVMWH